jgi:hypothetical protein
MLQLLNARLARMPSPEVDKKKSSSYHFTSHLMGLIGAMFPVSSIQLSPSPWTSIQSLRAAAEQPRPRRRRQQNADICSADACRLGIAGTAYLTGMHARR